MAYIPGLGDFQVIRELKAARLSSIPVAGMALRREMCRAFHWTRRSRTSRPWSRVRRERAGYFRHLGRRPGRVEVRRNPSWPRSQARFLGRFARGSDLSPDVARRLVSLVRSDWELARTNLATATMSTNSPGNAVRLQAAALRDNMSQDVAAGYMEAIAEGDASADAAGVTAPALVLHRQTTLTLD